MRKGLIVASMMALALAACGPQGQAPAGGDPQTAAAAPSSCDSPAVPVAVGSTTDGNVAAAQSYPENARYYCFQVAEGSGPITVSVSGMSADLDLFVGSNGIASVQGVQLEQGQTYEWMSNRQGTAEDSVTINTPRAGVYYAEIVSYQGQASNYQFSVR